MIKRIVICISIIIIASGCSDRVRSACSGNNESYLYSVVVDWETPEEFYDWGVSGWRAMVMPSGKTSSITVPIPDSVTFTWKTALSGGKEHYESICNSNSLGGILLPDESGETIEPEVNLFPSNLFQDHSATFVLKDKIPQYFQGDIYLTVKESGNVILRYVERQRMEDHTKYKQMDEYRIFIVNNQSPGTDIYDFKGTGWPLNSFYSLPIKAGYIAKDWPYTVPPKSTTLTWKTALEGGKEYYDNFDKIISEPSDTYKIERYPPDKFKEHRVTVEIDSDKIVEYGFGAQLIFYIYDNDRVEVEYRREGE